ncbi:MAG TPA: hypothetical protein VGL59_03020, partial [Polyangia bacterium]
MILIRAVSVVVGLPLMLAACSKQAPETIEAPASAAEPPPAAQDTTPPPGLDISKFDELQKKVFFRIVNSEPAICGQAQSLIQSAKKDASCRRSLNAVRYVAKLVDQGYTDSEISEALAKRYRNATPKFIDVSEAPMKGNPNAKVTL